MDKIAPYGKALTGAIITGLGAARLALTDDVISKAETLDIAVATLTALALVWAIPNKDPEGEHQDESVQPVDGVVDATPETDDGLTYEEAGGQPYPDRQAPQPESDGGYWAAGDPDRA